MAFDQWEIVNMGNIYTDGEYLKETRTWHAEDSPWKAEQIVRIIRRNDIHPRSIAEIGCGAGQILRELSKQSYLKDVQFRGYDISPQAISLCRKVEIKNVEYSCQDLLTEDSNEHFDILLVIDVLEHIPDYIGFAARCRAKADYKIYHIPLDLHVSSVLRNSFVAGRYSIGHLHYFAADSAVATIRDAGHEILDYFYTNRAFGVFKQHPSIKTAIANVPRWLFSKFSVPFTARVFGGYSLLILAR